jgi:hypothetical protein
MLLEKRLRTSVLCRELCIRLMYTIFCQYEGTNWRSNNINRLQNIDIIKSALYCNTFDSQLLLNFQKKNKIIIFWLVIYCNANKRERKPKVQSVIGQSRNTDNIWYMRHRTKTNKTKTQHRKLNRRATRTLPCNQGWTQVLAKGKQFLPLIRHSPCYPYSQYIPWAI